MPFKRKVRFQPRLFVETPNDTGYKSIFGANLKPLNFETIKDARNYLDRFGGIEGGPKHYGQPKYQYQYISETWDGEVPWDISSLGIITIDIETTVEHGFPSYKNPIEEIILITASDKTTGHITTFGTKPYVPTNDENRYRTNFEYIECGDETTLLESFLEYLDLSAPDAISGWNVGGFDIPYLAKRIERVLGEGESNRLSPWGYVYDKAVYDKMTGRESLEVKIVGLPVLDYMDIYKKYTSSSQESFALNHIAFVELEETKVDNPYSTFKEFYEQDWNLFVEYNIRDVELVSRIDDKNKFMELLLTIAYDSKCNWEDVFSPVATWGTIIYNYCLNENTFLPIQSTENTISKSIQGGYVKTPVPGRYKYVATFDATSLYPSIIMQYNMSPETLLATTPRDVSVESLLAGKNDLSELKERDICMTANGYHFTRKTRGVFPKITEKIFAERVLYKNKKLDAERDYEKTKDPKFKNLIARYHNNQQARKILLNSLFGASANVWFVLFDPRIAEGITMSGQYIIRHMGNVVNKYMNKVCKTEGVEYAFYEDTDSVMITLDTLVRKHCAGKSESDIIDFMDKVCKTKLAEVLEEGCRELVDYTNAYEPRLYFKREALASSGIWTAKKRYALYIHDMEGVRYKEPFVKVTGLATRTSTIPVLIRKDIAEVVKLALTRDEADVQNYVAEVKEKFHSFAAEDIATATSVNGMTKYANALTIFSKGCPGHVRAALTYNHHVAERGLETELTAIRDSDKIKWVYLRTPNQLKASSFAWIGKFPSQFDDIKPYIDYDAMFEKQFVRSINKVLEAVGWTHEQRATLMDLFE